MNIKSSLNSTILDSLFSIPVLGHLWAIAAVISFILLMHTNSANAGFQDNFTNAGLSSDWSVDNASDDFSAVITQPGDGFLHLDASGGTGWNISGVSHVFASSPISEFTISVILKADFGNVVGSKRGLIEIVDSNDFSYTLQIGRNEADTWKGEVCDSTRGCLETEFGKQYSTNEVVKFTIIKIDSEIEILMNGVPLLKESSEFASLHGIKLGVSTNHIPGPFSVLFDDVMITDDSDGSCTEADLSNARDEGFTSGINYCKQNPADCGLYAKSDLDNKYNEGFANAQAACDTPVSSGGCAVLDDDLNIKMPCVNVFGNNISVDLKRFFPADADSGFFWEFILE